MRKLSLNPRARSAPEYDFSRGVRGKYTVGSRRAPIFEARAGRRQGISRFGFGEPSSPRLVVRSSRKRASSKALERTGMNCRACNERRHAGRSAPGR